MQRLARILISVSATSWILSLFAMTKVYESNNPCSVLEFIEVIGVTIALLALPIMLSFFSLLLAEKQATDLYAPEKIVTLRLADTEFLPVYLGYFFVSFSVHNWYACVIVFVVVSAFACAAHAFVFNPFWILCGYHFYHIETGKNTMIFAVIQGSVISKAEEVPAGNYYEISNSTYIVHKEF